jgi:hypothetical protein
MPKLTIADLSPELRRMALTAKCEKDFAYWTMNYGVIEIREVGIRPFKEFMWPMQKSFLDLLATEPRLIVLKARQLGVSTMTMHRAYHRIRFGPPNSEYVLVLSKSKEDAAYLLGKVSTIHKGQPPELAMPALIDRATKFQLENGNTIECLASTEAGGRSRAATLVILDEHAFHQFAEKNWTALKPTLEGGGQVIIISTGNGVGNLFQTMYQQAKEAENSFTPVFIPYNAAPNRDQNWYDSEKSEYPTEEAFEQEYPRTDTEAFTKSGTSPFDLEWIGQQIAACRPPQGFADGRIRVWEHPMAGVRYVAGLDVAQGANASGNSDRTSLKIGTPHGTIVAAWDGKEELGVASQEIHDLLLLYNSPFIVVERNGPGSGFIAALQALGYTNFYRFQKRHVIADAPEEKNPLVGIQMTPLVKSRMVSLLAQYINSHTLRSDDVSFWKECTTFVQTGPTKWSSQGGTKDDQVISTGWCVWAIQYMLQVLRRKKKKVKWV